MSILDDEEKLVNNQNTELDFYGINEKLENLERQIANHKIRLNDVINEWEREKNERINTLENRVVDLKSHVHELES